MRMKGDSVAVYVVHIETVIVSIHTAILGVIPTKGVRTGFKRVGVVDPRAIARDAIKARLIDAVDAEIAFVV